MLYKLSVLRLYSAGIKKNLDSIFRTSLWNTAARRFSSDPATIFARHDLADDRWVNAITVPAAGNFADARHEHQKLCQEDGANLAMMPEVPRRRRSRITQSAPPRRSGTQCSHLPPLFRTIAKFSATMIPMILIRTWEKQMCNFRIYPTSSFFREKRKFTFDNFKVDFLDFSQIVYS